MELDLARRSAGLALILSIFSSVSLAQSSGVIVISEIMYHPAEGGQELEYVELSNTTPAPIDLSGWFFSEGIAFEFPAGTWIEGRRYLVVAADGDRIRSEYGIENVVGNWTLCTPDGAARGCALSNSGELIELNESNGISHARVRYDDRGVWPSSADGTGHSLELKPVYNQNEAESWAPSGVLGGSPGRESRTEVPDVPVIINEAFLATGGQRWIELYNGAENDEDISGFFVSDTRGDLFKAELPPGTIVRSGGWLVLDEATLGLDLSPVGSSGATRSVFVALTHSDRDRVVDAVVFEPEIHGKSEARYPDGGRDLVGGAEPTPAAANRVNVERDVVINEIMYNSGSADSAAEFVELFNRSVGREIDVSEWTLTGGIDFRFPQGVKIKPLGYLVVANDRDLMSRVYSLATDEIVGPAPDDIRARAAFGILGNDGERITLSDRGGNVTDTVRYHDGGEWPIWADGGGSSLELVDPRQDNDVAGAWAASDESEKAEITSIRCSGTFRTGEPELHFVLPTSGIVLVDDVTVSRRRVVLRGMEELVADDARWMVFKGRSEPSNPPEAWRQPGFSDSHWFVGHTPIGFGEGDERTSLDDMQKTNLSAGYTSFYCRHEFHVSAEQALETAVFRIESDDGYIAYINGAEVARSAMGSRADFSATASRTNERLAQEIVLADLKGFLREGTNVLAIQVHNFELESPDARLVATLASGKLEAEDGPEVFGEDFEAPLGPEWLLEGTHSRSGRTTVAPVAGAASLKLVATGSGDNKVNRAEVELEGLETGAEYTVSFKARWVAGSPTLLTHGHNRGRNFDYPDSHQLRVPVDRGTPGRINSVTNRLIKRGGDADHGPVIDQVKQSVPAPRAGDPVTITARVQDSSGVVDVSLYWSQGLIRSPAEANRVVMQALSGHRWRGTIPGHSLGTRIVFFIVATDARGFTRRFPVDILERTNPLTLDVGDVLHVDRGHAVYGVGDGHAGSDAGFPSYRFWLSDQGELSLDRRRLLSNDFVSGSLLLAGRDLHYNARARFSGSPFAREPWNGSFRIALAKDRPLHGAIKKFNLENHQRGGGRSAFERISNYLIRHNQGNVKVPYSYQWLASWQLNNRNEVVREHIQVPDVEFVERWFPNDDRGAFFEMDDRHEIDDRGARVSSQDASLRFPPQSSSGRGDDREQYRYYFNLRMNEEADDFSHLISLARVMDTAHTSDELFDDLVWSHLDVEAALRAWSIRLNTDDGDQWGARRGKNWFLYRGASGGLWTLIPWDMEISYGDVDSFMPPPIASTYVAGSFPEVNRLLNRPRIKRLYYGIVRNMIEHQFRSSFLAPFRDRLASTGLKNLEPLEPDGWIDQRRSRLSAMLETATSPGVTLAITTNGGFPFVTRSSIVLLEGKAPVEMFWVTVMTEAVGEDEAIVASLSANEPLGWRAEVPLVAGANQIDVFGFSDDGELLGMATIDVSSELDGPAAAKFRRGDVNSSGSVTISDAVAVLGHLFLGRVVPCEDAADADDSGRVTIADAVFLLDYLVRRGAPPSDPFVETGSDPTPDGIGCGWGGE